MVEMHFPGKGCWTSEMLLWLTEMEYAKIRTHGKAKHYKAQHGETGACVLKAEPKMDANNVVKEWKYWVLCWLLQEMEPRPPGCELKIWTTMPRANDVFKITAVFISLYRLRMP